MAPAASIVSSRCWWWRTVGRAVLQGVLTAPLDECVGKGIASQGSLDRSSASSAAAAAAAATHFAIVPTHSTCFQCRC
uniref:Putative secreted protein n=1 Tax=Anopheles marajoara TaxID=58244 RepID=A0A2M4CCB5_9DIPT